jgi:hypothetical protein
MKSMTAPSVAAPATAVPARDRLQRLALIGFPLVLIVSDLAVAGVSGDDSESYLASVAAHRGAVLFSAVAAMAAVLLFGVVAQVMSERLAPAAPRWAWYAKLAAWVGLFAGYAINARSLFDWAMTDPSLSRAEMVKLGKVLESPAIFTVLYNPGLLTPLGLLALGIGLWRTHSVPTWVGASLVFAAITFPVAQIGDVVPAQVLCAALFLAGGIGLMSTRSSQPATNDLDPGSAASESFVPARRAH